MEEKLAILFLGMALGVALHRLVMAFVLWKPPDNRCSYCQWVKKGSSQMEMRCERASRNAPSITKLEYPTKGGEKKYVSLKDRSSLVGGGQSDPEA